MYSILLLLICLNFKLSFCILPVNVALTDDTIKDFWFSKNYNTTAVFSKKSKKAYNNTTGQDALYLKKPHTGKLKPFQCLTTNLMSFPNAK